MAIYKEGKPISGYSAFVPVIKQGIPIPEARNETSIKVYEVALKMQIWDCIDVPYTRNPIAGNLSRATGYAFTQRKIGNILRIWRIE
jgi:hypothetical protein